MNRTTAAFLLAIVIGALCALVVVLAGTVWFAP